MMVFVSLCNRLQQIEFRSMLRFLFILANESLLLVWDCQPFTKRGNVPSFAWMQTWRWTFFARNLSPIHMPKNMIFIWKALRFFFIKGRSLPALLPLKARKLNAQLWSGLIRTLISITFLLVGFDELCVIYPSTPYFWKCGWNAMTNGFALVMLYLSLSVCTSFQSETGKLWFCYFHSQNVKVFLR